MSTMRSSKVLLDSVAATGAGTTYAGSHETCWVAEASFAGTSATVLLEGSCLPSPSSADWVTLATFTFTTTGTLSQTVLAPWPNIRGNVSAISGTVTLAVGF